MTVRLTNNARERLTAALSAVIGSFLAIGLVHTSWVPPARALREPIAAITPLRIKARLPVVTPPVAHTPPPAPLPIQQPDAPKAVVKPTPLPPEPPASAPPENAQIFKPVIEQAGDIAMQQPPTTAPTATPTDPDLPRLPQAAPEDQAGTETPPGAAEDTAHPTKDYAEQAGGDTLVMGMLVDSTGQVIDSKIIVPSHNALGDLTYAMVAKRQRVSNIQPPLAAGQTRWLEVRIYYPKTNQTALP